MEIDALKKSRNNKIKSDLNVNYKCKTYLNVKTN